MADHKIYGNNGAGNVQAPERIWASNRTNGNCVVSFTSRSEEYSIEYIRADVAEAELAAILALRDKPAPAVTVQKAARVLLDTMTTDRKTFDAMVDQAELTHGAGASFNKVIGNALRAIAGG